MIEDIWKAHYHITIEGVTTEQLLQASKLIRAKCTTIDLHRATHSQRDRMLTKYQRNIDLDQMFEDVIILQNEGFSVIRFKLEQMYPTLELFLCQDFSQSLYGETHIKTDAAYPEILTEIFRLSSNPEEVDFRFYNARIYSDEDKNKFLNAYQRLLYNKVPIKSMHLEKTIFDSNYHLDSWWA